MGRRLIPFEALKAKGIPFSKVHLWRLEKDGLFPGRVQTGHGNGGRCSYAYVEEEIDDHIEKLINARDEKLINQRNEKLISDSDDGRKTVKAASGKPETPQRRNPAMVPGRCTKKGRAA